MITGIAQFTVVVREYDEAIAFYVGVLGLQLLEDADLGGGKRWVRVGARDGSGATILLARAANEKQAARVGDQTGGRVGVFVHTDDCRGMYERLRGAGVRFRGEPRDEAYGSVVVFEDLYGNLIDLIEPRKGEGAHGVAGRADASASRIGAGDARGGPLSAHTVDTLDARTVSARDLDALTDVLLDAVESGSAVSFVLPVTRAGVRAWWEKTLGGMHPKGVVLVAREATTPGEERGAIVGTVQLQPAWAPNQPHRAEVCKMIVHRRARGAGVGKRLMEEVERAAREAGFTLLVLDTKKGSVAEGMYARMGWVRVGEIPRFAVDPDGVTEHATVVFYKHIC